MDKYQQSEFSNMSFSNLKALRTFAEEEIAYWTARKNSEKTEIWQFNKSMVQQNIDRTMAEYFKTNTKTFNLK